MAASCILQIHAINNVNIIARLVPFLYFRDADIKIKRVA